MQGVSWVAAKSWPSGQEGPRWRLEWLGTRKTSDPRTRGPAQSSPTPRACRVPGLPGPLAVRAALLPEARPALPDVLPPHGRHTPGFQTSLHRYLFSALLRLNKDVRNTPRKTGSGHRTASEKHSAGQMNSSLYQTEAHQTAAPFCKEVTWAEVGSTEQREER